MIGYYKFVACAIYESMKALVISSVIPQKKRARMKGKRIILQIPIAMLVLYIFSLDGEWKKEKIKTAACRESLDLSMPHNFWILLTLNWEISAYWMSEAQKNYVWCVKYEIQESSLCFRLIDWIKHFLGLLNILASSLVRVLPCWLWTRSYIQRRERQSFVKNLLISSWYYSI